MLWGVEGFFNRLVKSANFAFNAVPAFRRIEVGHSLALDTGSSSTILRFTLHWPYLDSTIKLSSDTRRGKWVGKVAVLWPGAWK